MDRIMDAIFNTLRKQPLRRGPRRMLAGICGGIAEQWNVDVRIVRVIALLSCALPGISPLTYLLLWALLPSTDNNIPAENLLRKITG